MTALAAMMMAGSAQASSFASNDSGLSFMGLFGMNISNMHLNNDLTIGGEGLDPKVGFNLGARAEYILPECFGIFVNGGLEYTMKGAKDKISTGEGGSITYLARPMYLQLPIHVGYRYNLLDDLGLYADFGPYFAVGINGKSRLQYDTFEKDYKEKFFNNSKATTFYEVQRWDFGLGFRIGAEYAQHYNLIFSCDWGVTNMLTQEQKNALYNARMAELEFEHPTATETQLKGMMGDFNPAIKNFNAAITFGYRF